MYEEIGKKLKKDTAKQIRAEFPQVNEAGKKGAGSIDEVPDFARSVKRLRNDHGLSLEKLSEKTGINKQTLHSIENYSIKNPSFANLEKIATALDLSLNDLVTMARGEFRGNLFKTTAAQRWMVNFETEKGFTIHAYSAPSSTRRDFFIGVMTIKAGKKLRYWQFRPRSKACIQPWDDELLFIYHGMNWRREEEVLANETLYFDASIPHTFENHSDRDNRILLVTYPSIF